MTGHRAWDPERAALRIRELEGLPGPLLPILNALQAEFGCIPEAADALVADALNLSLAEVRGVVGFYHDFRRAPPGRHVMRVCRAEACQAMGCGALIDHLRARLGIDFGETTGDGSLTLEAVYCLGNCALSPALLLDGRLHGRVSKDLADRLIDEASARSRAPGARS